MARAPRATPRPKPKKPWEAADYTKSVVRAIQALQNGRATLTDQKLAFNWIVNGAAGLNANGFMSDDPNGRIAAFVDGRQWVGQQIMNLTRIKPEVLNDE